MVSSSILKLARTRCVRLEQNHYQASSTTAQGKAERLEVHFSLLSLQEFGGGVLIMGTAELRPSLYVLGRYLCKCESNG